MVSRRQMLLWSAALGLLSSRAFAGPGRSPTTAGMPGTRGHSALSGESVQSGNRFDRFLDYFGMGPRSHSDWMAQDRARSRGGGAASRGGGNFGRHQFNEK